MLNKRLSKVEISNFSEDILAGVHPVEMLYKDLESSTRLEVFNALWIFKCLLKKNPYKLDFALSEIFKSVYNNHTDQSIVRVGLSIFKEHNIPPDLEGIIFSFCTKLLSSSKVVPIANRAMALHICTKICKKHPPLVTELWPLVKITNERYSAGSPGIKSAVTKTITTLEKLRF